MLEILKKAVQSVLIWLLLFINGGKLPPELLPPFDIPDIDWSSLIGQGSQWQVNVPASFDASAVRKAQLPRTQALPNADELSPDSDLLSASMGSLGGLTTDSSALLGKLAGGMSGAAGFDPSARIVNPSGVPREMLGGINPWRSKGGSRPGASTVTTEIVEAAPVEGRGATLGLILLGAGALAVAGYVVVRRRR